MTTSYTFQAGKYYIGDICYAILDQNWDKLIEETGCFGLDTNSNVNWDGRFIYNSQVCFVDSTAYGDGVFFDNEGREYGVDAGLIGIMPIKACDGDSMNGGNIVEFKTVFRVFANNGSFQFGNITIETGDTEEDDEEYTEEEDENYDDDSSEEYKF